MAEKGFGLRLSGGELGSRRLHVPRGRHVRPTPGRVREALFSILGARIEGARVLDLYAGTGVIGFEALSRGASHVTFVEAHVPSAARIRTHASDLGVADRAVVLAQPAERAARRLSELYDLVYADPPYALAFPNSLFEMLRLNGAIGHDTLVVYEHSARRSAEIPGFHSSRIARYGEVALEFMAVDA